MSVEAIAVVLHHSKAKGTAKLVLIGIANHEGDGGAWPSMATLAKYAGVNVRNARQAVQALRGLGEISVDVQGGGGAQMVDTHRPNLYRVQVQCPPWCDRTANHRDTRSVQPGLWINPRSQATPPVGDDPHPRSEATGDPRSEATSEPSIEPTLNLVDAVADSSTDRARGSGLCRTCGRDRDDCERLRDRALLNGVEEHAYDPPLKASNG